MRSALPLALLLAAGLVGCSEADDLGRALTEGPIEGQQLDGGVARADHDGDGASDEVAPAEPAGVDATSAPAAAIDVASTGEPAPTSADDGSLVSEDSAPTNGAAPTEPATPPDTEPAAATPKQPEPTAKKPAPKSGAFDAEDYEWADFDPMIDFDYPELVRVDGDTPPPKLPPDVLAMNGKRIAIEGFMSPLAFDAGGVKEFSLVKDPSFCCFGAIPQMNHWIHVVMPEGQRTEFYSFDPIAVYGTLEVGEKYEDGYVVSLYRMVADKVEGDF